MLFCIVCVLLMEFFSCLWPWLPWFLLFSESDHHHTNVNRLFQLPNRSLTFVPSKLEKGCDIWTKDTATVAEIVEWPFTLPSYKQKTLLCILFDKLIFKSCKISTNHCRYTLKATAKISAVSKLHLHESWKLITFVYIHYILYVHIIPVKLPDTQLTVQHVLLFILTALRCYKKKDAIINKSKRNVIVCMLKNTSINLSLLNTYAKGLWVSEAKAL